MIDTTVIGIPMPVIGNLEPCIAFPDTAETLRAIGWLGTGSDYVRDRAGGVLHRKPRPPDSHASSGPCSGNQKSGT